MNAEPLTSYSVRPEALIDKCSIYSSRFWNLSEIGGTPMRNTVGSSHICRYMRKHEYQNGRVPDFPRTSQATLLTAICADVEQGHPVFVFKGKRLLAREVVVDVRIYVQTYA